MEKTTEAESQETTNLVNLPDFSTMPEAEEVPAPVCDIENPEACEACT